MADERDEDDEPGPLQAWLRERSAALNPTG